MRFIKDGRMTEVPDPDDRTGSAAARAATPLASPHAMEASGKTVVTPGMVAQLLRARGVPPRVVTVIQGPSGRVS